MRVTIPVVAVMLAGCSSGTAQGPVAVLDAGAGDASPDATPATPYGPTTPVACLAVGVTCSQGTCCNGAICVYDLDRPSDKVCATTCLRDDQCVSGCCKTLSEGKAAVCAPAKYCAPACSDPGESCASGQTCCAGAICVTSTRSGSTCADACTAHTQCYSGCCAPLVNSPFLVCSAAEFCR